MGRIFGTSSLLVMLSLAMSCGKRPQVVTAIQVQTQTINQDVHLSLQADLNLGNMSFPTVTLPVYHPHSQQQLGSVDLLPVLGGKNQVKISVNVSALADIHASQAYLPNGNAIPLIANNPTITVPLPNSAKLYLTLGANAVALGVAVPIRTFDGIGSSVGGLSLFPTFVIDQVIGSAGIFTSRQQGQNGFALIADVTAYVKMQDIYVPGVAQTMHLDYAEKIPDASKEEKVNRMIYDLNRRGTRLQLK